MAASNIGTPAPVDLLAEAEAEAAEAEASQAEAAAVAARAHAVELRRKSAAQSARQAAEEAASLDNAEAEPPALRLRPTLGGNAVAVGLGVLALVALSVLSGALIWHHREPSSANSGRRISARRRDRVSSI